MYDYKQIFPDDYSELQSYVNHPVHVVDEEDNLNPSAFIPFCAFGGDMTILSKHMRNFSFPLCSSFQPRLLDGQLCYFIDLDNATKQRPTSQGPAHGLTLFLDYNEERMVGRNTEAGEEDDLVVNLNDRHEETKKEAKIHIDTLEPFIGHGRGNYELSAIKVLSATDSFLSLPEAVRECQTEYSLLECRLEQYRALASSCGCVPFTSPGLFHNITVGDDNIATESLICPTMIEHTIPQ